MSVELCGAYLHQLLAKFIYFNWVGVEILGLPRRELHNQNIASLLTSNPMDLIWLQKLLIIILGTHISSTKRKQQLLLTIWFPKFNFHQQTNVLTNTQIYQLVEELILTDFCKILSIRLKWFLAFSQFFHTFSLFM